MGFQRPFVGPLLSAHFHDPNGELAIYPEHGPALETEFLVAVAADLPARDAPYSDEEVMAAVDFVCPTFEIVACRADIGFAAAGSLATLATFAKPT